MLPSRKLRALLLFAFCFLATTFASLWFPRPLSIAFRAVQIGMPRWESHLITGLPSPRNSWCFAKILPGDLSFADCDLWEDFWGGGSGMLIFFDENGRVVAKELEGRLVYRTKDGQTKGWP
jgi:hypothetical protein